MRIIVSDGHHENHVVVEWDEDDSNTCVINLTQGGTLHTNSEALRNLYECLDVLYGRPTEQRKIRSS